MISIVIPTFNEEKEIEKTVRQFEVLAIPHEVIVSDTKSTDRTVAIAKMCGARVILLAPDKKPGVAIGRNNGAKAARGDLIVFIDSSTVIPDVNRSFERILSAFTGDPNLVAATGRVEVDPAVQTFSDRAVMGLMNIYYWILNNVFHFGIAIGKLQVVRAEAFRTVNGFDESLAVAEDIDFFARIGKLGRTELFWQVIAFYSGRRFHQVGAWTTLFQWIKNAVTFWLFKKPADKEWDSTIR